MNDQKVELILTDLIDLPERQMRRDIDRDSLHELAANIQANGLISPITVRPKGDRFELVAGQRRLLACGIARIIRIPCVIRTLDDAAAVSIMASENLERKDVDPVDEANWIKVIMDAENLSVGQMAERLSRSPQYVKDRLVVGEMPEYMRDFIKSGDLKLGVALELMAIEPEEKRRVWVGMAIEQNINVRTASWWAEQHRLGTLPGSVENPGDVPNAPPGEPIIPMFTCAVDGKDYPASDCQAVFVFKGNLEYLAAVRKEFSAPPSENALQGGG